MTEPGNSHVQTPIAGLIELALTAPTFAELTERAAQRPAELRLVDSVIEPKHTRRHIAQAQI